MGVQPLSQESSLLLTVEELSRELKVPVATIYFWVHRREVPFIKMGRHLRFERDAVLHFFRQRTEDRHQTCSPLDSLVHLSALNGRKPFRSSLKRRDWNLAETKKECNWSVPSQIKRRLRVTIGSVESGENRRAGFNI